MPKAGRDVNQTFSYYQQNADGTQGDPLYLTTTGESGGTPLTFAAWLKHFPEDASAELELASGDGLTVLAAPNDNVLSWNTEFLDFELDAGDYYMDIVALISPTSRLDFGTFKVTIRPQITQVPIP